MKVTPKTEKEIVELNLLPNGWYPFTIGEAEEKTSKAGNDMIALNVKVYKGEGFVFIRDFLMDTEFGAGKLRHCADTCGALADYEGGTLAAELLLDREGFVKIGVEKGKNGYSDKNKIIDYAKEAPKPKGETTATGEKKSYEDPDEESIPF